MHTKPDLHVFLKWLIAHSGWVITDVMRLNMKFKISSLILAMLVVSIALAIWIPNYQHRERWKKLTELSLPKSQWVEKSLQYSNSVNEGFSCLENSDSEFVDFRSWRKEDKDRAWWTIWRTPCNKSLLDAHLEHFELTKHALSNDMTVLLYQSMPFDWVLEHDSEFEVYQPKSQLETSSIRLDLNPPLGRSLEDELFNPIPPEACQVLLHDIENDILYFYTMTSRYLL